MSDWNKIEIWRKRKKTFTVEVYHSKDFTERNFGGNCWNIYVYIYCSHPLFGQLEPGGGMKQEPIRKMPFHWGASFFHAHFAAGGVLTSYQIGCDYRHLHDEAYSFMKTEEEAEEIFEDAEKLLAYFEAAAAFPPAHG